MRPAIVAAARTWIGTPYHHQQRVKGLGVDCAGLVIGVARELGMVTPSMDVTGYARTADGVSFLQWCDHYMMRITAKEMAPGDCVAVAFGKYAQHIGILGDYVHGGLSIIHALHDRGVVETRLLFGAPMRLVNAYRMPQEGACLS